MKISQLSIQLESYSPIRLVAVAVLALVGSASLYAQSINITAGGTTTQNFNDLPTTGTATLGANGDLSTINASLMGWFAQRSGTGTTIVADTGSGTGGNLYSYGSTSNTDRALGSLGSGNATAGSFAYGVQFINRTGGTVAFGTLAYVGEEWRNGAAPAQTVTFFSKTGTSLTTNLTPTSDTGWSANAALNFTSPVTGGTAGALNGNLAANRVNFSASSGISLSNGQGATFRWSDIDHSGTDHGLAIDDFSIAYTVTSPTELYFDRISDASGLGSGGGTWNTSGLNWNGDASGDGFSAIWTNSVHSSTTAVFDGTGGAVTVGSAISAGGMTFKASNYTIGAGTITLGGATPTVAVTNSLDIATVASQILGANGLVKAGAGSLTLSGDNTYTGTTKIIEGTLLLGANERIANASNVELAGGTLNTGGFSETVGTLTLSANSTLDLSTINSRILTFADSSALTASWTGTLSILNYDGVAGVGNSIFFGSSAGGLTVSQLGMITAYSGGLDSTAFGVTLTSSGELIAIPEPAATLTAALLLGTWIFRRQRRGLLKNF